MAFVIRHFRWVMLISGVITSTMFYGVFAPRAAIESMFGATFDGTLESLVIRSWSALVGLMGVVLIYGAFSERHRTFALSIAAASKAMFIGLMLVHGRAYLGSAAPAIVMDAVVVLLAAIVLIAARQRRRVAR